MKRLFASLALLVGLATAVAAQFQVPRPSNGTAATVPAAMTAGRVVYATGTSTVATDSGLLYDSANKRLQLSGDGQTLDAVATNEKPALHIGRDYDGVAGAGAIYLDTYGAQPNITMRRSNGTQASKTALADADIIFNFRSFGYNTTDGFALGGLMRMVQNGTNTTSNHGQDFLVALTANGSTSAPVERLRVRGDSMSVAVPVANTAQTVTTTGTSNALAVTSSFVRLNNASDLTVNGIAAGVNGQEVTFVSVGAGNVFFSYQSGSAAAGDKLNNFVTSGLTPLAAGKGRATYRYDSTAAIWQLVDHEQGDFLTFTFSAGDFSANGSMTWTVASGDVGSDVYMIRGRSMIWSFRVNTTTVGGTPNNQLIMTLPGYNIRAGNYMHIIFANDNGTEMAVRMVNISTNTFSIVKLGGANWTASTDNTIINGTLTLGVS